MKKLTCIRTLLVFCVGAFLRAQNHFQKLTYPNGKEEGEGMIDTAGKLTGDWTFFYEDGMKKSGRAYTSGKATGCWFFFGENGKLSSYGWYKKDLLDSVSRFFFPSGGIQTEAYFKNDTLEGR